MARRDILIQFPVREADLINISWNRTYRQLYGRIFIWCISSQYPGNKWMVLSQLLLNFRYNVSLEKFR
jgi:hypothetical protein